MRRLIITALAMVASALILVPPGATAAPTRVTVTCSGYGCDHLDPVATGCSVGAQPVTSAPISYNGVIYGTLDLRWSPMCQTNWARVTVSAGGNNPSRLWREMDVTRYSPNDTDVFGYNGNGSPIYGNMLYAPGCAAAHAGIEIDPNYGIWADGYVTQPGC